MKPQALVAKVGFVELRWRGCLWAASQAMLRDAWRKESRLVVGFIKCSTCFVTLGKLLSSLSGWMSLMLLPLFYYRTL